ncbi:MAG: bifunctional diguanylate cyclase/phosphodiesterase [Blautia sp.]|jgi:diguanylate cyclase (GGDEF)-like protein
MRNFYIAKEKRNKKFHKLLLTALVLVTILIASLCIHFTMTLYQASLQETENYLEELSKKSARLIRKQMEADFELLHLAAQSCSSMSQSTAGYQEELKYLRSLQTYSVLYELAIVGNNGTVYFTDGDVQDLSDSPMIQKALRGQDAASFDTYPVTGQSFLYLAVPIKDSSHQIQGALLYQKLPAKVQKELGIDSFDQQGHSHIINGDGEIIISSTNMITEYGNLFHMLESITDTDPKGSLEQMKVNIKDGQSGMFYFKKEDEKSALLYVPLGMDDWYLITSVPVKAINEPILHAIHLGLLMDACVFLAFFLFLFLFQHILRSNEQELERLAFRDTITGGDNSVAFEHRMAQIIRNTAPSTYALAAIDILEFKLINKTFGEKEGDRILLYIYNCIKRHLAPDEYMARIEADKFKLLLKNAPEEEMRARLTEISLDINSYNQNLSVPYHITICAGIRVVDDNRASIIRIRDDANLARKKSHKKIDNQLLCISFYVPKDEELLLREKELTDLMGTALAQHQFQVYLQPKIRLDTRKIGGAEALVRWAHPEYGMIPPNEFIPLFEQNGFIIQLDEYMFEQACLIIRQWMDQGIDPVPISINMSRREVGIPGILDKYQKIQEKYQIPPQLLELELTENLITENVQFYNTFFQRIQEMQFQCSLDDFGSGYSSMNMLKDISVNTLKLDKEFFSESVSDQNDKRGKAVIQSVISLSKQLDMQIVAEGVETLDQVEFLEENGCDMVQGYYFSRPVPAAKFPDLLKKETWE